MEPIREHFFLIPLWAKILLYLLVAGVIIFWIVGFGRIVLTLISLQREETRRLESLKNRFKEFIVHVIAQVRVIVGRDISGLSHAAMFWGFGVLLLGTIIIFFEADLLLPLAHVRYIKGSFYLGLEFFLDLLGLVAIIGLAWLMVRRFLIKPPELTHDIKFAGIIILLLLVVLTGFILEGLRISHQEPEWAKWSFLGYALSKVVGGGEKTYLGLWLAHLIMAMVVLALLPYTHLTHILLAPFNVFLKDLDPYLKKTERKEGVGTLKDFTWKDGLMAFSCTECGRCTKVCPANNVGYYLSPKHVMLAVRYGLEKNRGVIMKGNNIPSIFGDKASEDPKKGTVSPEEVWACTTCLACFAECPVFNSAISLNIKMRRKLVYEGNVEQMLQTALTNFQRYGNSFGQSPRARARWAQGLEIKDARKEEVEYLWFVGDFSSYDATVQEITKKASQVFSRIGLDFGILYDEERNSGNDVRRIGEEGLFEMLMERNLKAMGKAKFKKIITTDPHSYNALKNEYSEFNFEVYHYTEVLEKILDKLNLKKLGYKVTYHDPCYLGRYNDIYDPPRRIIKALGIDLVEMPRSRQKSFCCGAGGGRIWMEDPQYIKERPSENRIKEAVALGVQYIVVVCPKDFRMFQDAIKTTGNEGKIEVKELLEFVAEALVE